MNGTTGSSESGGRAARMFRACMRLYPESFRAEFGLDMVETFEARLSEAERSFLRRTFHVIRECSAAASGGLALRFRGLMGTVRGAGTVKPRAQLRPTSAPRRTWDLLRDLGQDLRQALRALGRRPSVTANGVVALGLGIGLTTIMFCLIYGAAFRPLPVPDGNRIVHIEHVDPIRGLESLDVSLHDLFDWRSQQTSFEDLGGFYTGTVNLSGGDRPERFFGAFVTANTFDILQVAPISGRGFLSDEGSPEAPPVLVISHAVWKARFGGEADVVGRVVRVNGEPATVVGIMPEGFGFPYWQDVWIPIRDDPVALERGHGPGLEVFGRLRESVPLDRAVVEFQAISRRLAQVYPDTNAGREAFLEPYTLSYLGPQSGPGFVLMLLTVLGVLLVACFNVANLLLAQAVTRIRDMAIRVAMGASRRRVVTQVLQEALLLAAMGAVLGTGLAVAGVEVINQRVLGAATFPPPFWMVFRVDAPILLFVVAVTGLCAVFSGLIPAMRASRTDVRALLQDTSRGGTSLRMGRLSQVLVAAELTVSGALVVASGHLALEVIRTWNADYGYPADEVLTARVGLFEGLFPTRESRLAFHEELQARLEKRPGVVSAGLATALPGVEVGGFRFSIQGEDHVEDQNLPWARSARVSPGFFKGLDIPVLQGREFTRQDDAASPLVAVVNQSFAERFFPEGDPVGRRMRPGGPEDGAPWLTVVGVVPDLHMDGALEREGDPQGVYRPVAQGDVRFLSIAVRTRGDPLAFATTLRQEVMGLQEDTPIYFVETLRDVINTGLLDILLLGSLFIAFGLAAFFMASVGLYAVTSFLASQKTRELGLRLALGAKAGDILELVLRQGLIQVSFGLGLGLLVAAGARQVFGSLGTDVAPWSLAMTASVCLVLGATGLWAVFVPALRATRVDPMETLREE